MEDGHELSKIGGSEAIQEKREKEQKSFEFFKVDTIKKKREGRKEKVKGAKLVGHKTWRENISKGT